MCTGKITDHEESRVQRTPPLLAHTSLFPTVLATPHSQDKEWQVCVLKAIDTWLAEDHTRAEGKLTQREPVAALVDLYARTHQSGGAQVRAERT